MPNAETRLPERNLDLLRAFAVLCVLANHLDMAAGDQSAVRLLFGYWLGRAGVLAFFVHTSLVLMASLERLRAPRAVPFYIRRAFRIYPLAIAVVLIVVAARLGADVPTATSALSPVAPAFKTTVANLLLVQNLTGAPNLQAVLWTLPIEVQMYLVLPVCFIVAGWGPRAVAGLLVIGVVAAYPYLLDLVPGIWRLNTLMFVPCFLSGVLAFSILRRWRSPIQLPSWVWFAFLPANLVAWWWVGIPKAGSEIDWNSLAWLQWACCLVIALAIPIVAELPTGVPTRVAKAIAKYSYGIYLLHMPALAIGLILCRGAGPLIEWSVVVVALVGLPVAAYHIVEEPGIRLGTKLARSWSGRRNGSGSSELDASQAPPP